MQRLLGSALVLSLSLVFLGSYTASTPALAEGPESAELGAGGAVKGDISSTPGEEDRIGIDLVAGSELSVKFVPKFKPEFELLDPDGQPFPLAAPKGTKTIAKGIPISVSGHYEFRIAATEGTQGGYKLAAKTAWAGKLSFDGSSGDTIEVTMPAGARVKASVKAVQSPGYVPRIDGLSGPDDAELSGPFEGRGSKASMPWVTGTIGGAHRLTVGASEGSGSFRVVLKRKVAKASAAKLDITNGINSISFAEDGVAEIFANRCASCHSRNHSWAATYAGVTGRLSDAFSRIQRGSMPPDGRLPATEISLIEQWIKTGRNR